MARVYALPPIPGVKDFLTLTEFLANKDACEARLNALMGLEEEINGLVEKVAKAEEIDPLHTQALATVQEANKKLAEAEAVKEQAAKIKLDADAYAQKVHDDMEVFRKEMIAQGEAMTVAQAEHDAKMADQEALLKAWEEKLKEREELARQAHGEAQTLINLYNEKLAKLKSLAEGD